MKISQRGIDLIKSSEGLKLKAYLCPAGIWTIGYGFTKGVRAGMTITEEQATHLKGIKDIGVYFGFDSKTNPEKYVTCNKCNGSGYVLFAHDKVKCPVCNGNKTVCR